MNVANIAPLGFVLALASLGCGGGPGASAPDGPSEVSAGDAIPSPPTLVAAAIGRIERDAAGRAAAVVHPLASAPTEATAPVALDMAALDDPFAPELPVVPRDAALLLAFEGDLADATFDVVTAGGASVPFHAEWLDGQLALSGVTDTTRGWPAGGVLVDPLGRPVPDASRALTLLARAPSGDAAHALLTFLPAARGLDVPGLTAPPAPRDATLARDDAATRGRWLPGATPRLARDVGGRRVPLAAEDDVRAALRVFDEHGVERLDVWDARSGRFLAIPPRSRLVVGFDAAVDDELVRTYETVLVRAADASADALADGRALRPGFGELSRDGRDIAFVPRLEDGTFLGFGGTAARLELVLRGVLGDDEIVIPFETLAGAGPDFGVVVHAFRGPAQVVPGEGVTYAGAPPRDSDGDDVPDARGTYGPSLLDVAVDAPGFLTGAAKRSLEHLIDDFNAPKPSAFASPNGEDFLIGLGFGLSLPFDAPFGGRFQQIWRAGDASPAQNEFEGVALDLVGMAWAPHGDVQEQTLDGVEILVGLSGANRGRGPNTNQSSGIPVDPHSGLAQQFDCNLLEWHEACCQTEIVDALAPFVPGQPHQTTVVSPGTSYTMRQSDLFAPANAVPGSFHEYLSFPAFDSGVDPYFGRDDVHAFPYDSRFPMLFEMRIAPGSAPSAVPNLARFSPAIVTSVLPRFRTYSMGQHPLAGGVPNYSLGVTAFPGVNTVNFRAGEGGPLVAPGTLTMPLEPPQPNNGMVTIPPADSILPPRAGCVSLQPEPDWVMGQVDTDGISPTHGCVTQLPQTNSDPYANWYFANGMLPRPFPNLEAYPGPTAPTPTFFAGYGVPPAAGAPGAPAPCILDSDLQVPQQPGITSIEPSYTLAPARYGDNARYYTLWEYSKRVSVVTSSAALARRGVKVHWYAPTLVPPLDELRAQGDLRVEFRAASGSDAETAISDSGWLDLEQSGLASDLTGDGTNTWIAFRALFGTAPDAHRPPKIDGIVMPFAY